MISGEKAFPVFRLPLLVLLISLTIVSFGGVPQTRAHFEKIPLAPVFYYFIYFAAGGLLVLMLWWFCAMAYRRKISFRRTPLDVPLLLLLVYVTGRMLFSEAPYLVSTELLKLLLLVGFFYFALNNTSTREQVRFVVFSILAATFLVSVYGLTNTLASRMTDGEVTVLGLERFSGYGYRVGGTYICPNHFAGLLEMMIPFTVSYIIISRLKVSWKLVLAVAGLVMIVAMVFTQSRGGWASICAGMVTVGLVSIRKVRIPLVAVVAPAVVITVLLIFLVASTPTLNDRVMETFREEDSSYAHRRDAWLDTLKMARHNILLGTAPGTYEDAVTRYQRPGNFVRINYAHNDYLQALTEYGIIALGIIIFMIAVVAKLLGRALNTLTNRDDFAYVSGFLGGFVAIAVHSFVDFNMHIPANAILMMVLLGMLFSIRHYSLEEGKDFELLNFRSLPRFKWSFGLPASLFMTLLVSMGLLLTVKRGLGSYYHHLGRQEDVSIRRPITGESSISENVKQEVVDNYLRARLFDPGNPAHDGALANIFLYQGESLRLFAGGATEEEERRKLIKELDFAETFERIKKAVKYGRRAAAGNPLNGEYHLKLAAASDIVARLIPLADNPFFPKIDIEGLGPAEEYTKDARHHYEMAVSTHPNLPYYREKLADFYRRNKEFDLARAAALKTIELLVESPEWKKKGATDILERMAAAYTAQKDYKHARELVRERIELAEEGFNWQRSLMPIVLEKLAYSCYRDEEYEYAREFAIMRLELWKKGLYWQTSKIPEVMEGLAGHYLSKADYEVARELASRTMKLLEDSPDWRKKKAQNILEEAEAELARLRNRNDGPDDTDQPENEEGP